MTTAPDITTYDFVLINSSGGKDSQAMLDYIVEAADAAGVSRDRLLVVHADLGRVEWAGTRELAAEQAAHYGLRFEVVSRGQDLLDQIEARGMFPSSTARYCTSDHKRDQVAKLLTKLAAEGRDLQGIDGRPVRILNCLGLRAQESPARRKRQAFAADARATNARRHVDAWLPIHDWTVEDVWARIKASGVRFHDAYRLGMTRLSCAFCIFASRADLLISAKANPALLEAYAAVEARIDHRFTQALSIAELRDLAAREASTFTPLTTTAAPAAPQGLLFVA